MTNLPTVSEETGFALQRELLESQRNQYVIKCLEILQKENPCVANFISQFACASEDPQSVAYAGVLVYKLLELQAEADQLKKLADL